MACDPVPFIEIGKIITDAEAIGPGVIDGLNHELGPVVTIGGIDVGQLTPAFLEAIHKGGPGFIRALRVEEVSDGHALGSGAGIGEETGFLEAVKPEELRLD